MKMHMISAAALATVAATPAASQTLLDKLVRRIAAPATQPGQVATSASALTAISPAQSTNLDRLLATPLKDARIAADRRDAGPLIREVLTTAACAKTAKAWNALNARHLTPETYTSPGFFDQRAAVTHMKYHDRATCLDVARVTDWAKPANNALRFRAYLVSASSGEAKDQQFELQKDTNGQWLIRQVGYIG